MIILSFCSFPWWLAWLLPFLLGLLAGWAIWSGYRARASELENDVSKYRSKASGLEGDLVLCNSRRAEAESELALVKGRIRELESEIASSSAKEIISEAKPEVPVVGISGAGQEADASDEADSGETSVSGTAPLSVYAVLKQDNLQIVEGIGPKMEEVLKENGVTDLGKLGSMSKDDLNNILGKYGEKYTRIIDPSTWPEQAALAHEQKWEELVGLQKSLGGGKSDKPTSVPDSKVEKILIKMGVLKKWKKNDLRAVEGIGPKIASLLGDAGINTWEDLSNTSVERIQEILDNAGSRYQLADPSTWPKQAGMAAAGKWKELREYQDFLQGGRE